MENMVRLDKKGTLLIAVVHSLQEPWLTIAREGQFKTWLRSIPQNVEVVHFHATDNANRVKRLDNLNEYLRWRAGGRISTLRNLVSKIILQPLRNWIPRYSISANHGLDDSCNVMRVHCWDMYATLRWKRLSVMNYFLKETNADYLLMTTSSSYVRPQLLLERILQIQSDLVYAGPLIGDARTKFVSGAQTVVNRKAASYIIENRKKIPVELLDDIGLGVFCSSEGIEPYSLQTLNIGSMEELKAISTKELQQNHHFRLKAEINGDRNDVSIFRKLNDLLQKS